MFRASIACFRIRNLAAGWWPTTFSRSATVGPHISTVGAALALERERMLFLKRFRSIKGATAEVWPGHYTPGVGLRRGQVNIRGSDRPTALFAANDLTALGALGAAREQGLIAGSDFALCGYDDIEIAAYGYISLTSISYSRKEGGRAARELLQARCAESTKPAQLVKVRPSIVVRGTSCAPPRDRR